jgi:glutamine amidotransferase
MSSLEVVVIDFGVGNLLSVQRGLEHCGAKVTITNDPEKILSARRVVLPGVGAFRNGMLALERLGLVPVISELALRRTPLLGICLGMQLLLEVSEEFGETKGLGLIPGRVIPVPTQTLAGIRQKIPHIGWSSLQLPQESAGWEDTLMQNNCVGEAAYFVHSFMAVPTDPAHRIADCVYGSHLIPATIGRDKITGCQFHPEKSGEVGLKILRRFCFD